MTAPNAAVLVPPVRLGRLLRDARETHGETLDELVRRCGLAFDEEWFRALESGRVALDESLVRWASTLYGVAAGEIAPARSRLVIDLDEGAVAIGERRVPIGAPVEGPTEPEQILANYLALVYLLRDRRAGTPLPLRDDDVNLLAQALQREQGDVRRRLGRLMSAEQVAIEHRTRGMRHRVIVPVAGILVGLTAVGGLLLVRSNGSEAHAGDGPAAEAGPTAVAAEIPVEIGDAVVLERGGVQTSR